MQACLLSLLLVTLMYYQNTRLPDDCSIARPMHALQMKMAYHSILLILEASAQVAKEECENCLQICAFYNLIQVQN